MSNGYTKETIEERKERARRLSRQIREWLEAERSNRGR
jgi:hypothetical protein